MKFKRSGSDTGLGIYENREHGFRLRAPRDWAKVENFGDAIVAFVRSGKVFKKSLSENVNITCHDLSANLMELEQFVDISLEDLKVRIPGFELIANFDTSISEIPVREIAYLGDIKKKQKMQWLQTLIKKDNKVYVITCASPQDKFDSFNKIARSMLASFEWLESPEMPDNSTHSDALQVTHVVTCFVVCDDKILLLKRSGQVGTYQGKWAGVSGHIDEGNSPLQQAYQELNEEIGLTETSIADINEGEIVDVTDVSLALKWVIHPFRITINAAENIKLDWEHIEYRWIDPGEIRDYETVPQLDAVWDKVK